MLAAMQKEQREQMRAGRVSFGDDSGESPEQQAIWKDGLAKILTAEEVQRLEGAKKEHQARRARALSQIMLVELDQKVAFTASQRERLLPIAERLVNERDFSSRSSRSNTASTSKLRPFSRRAQPRLRRR